MNQSLTFARIFFGFLSLFFMLTYTLSYLEGSLITRALIGLLLGGSFSLLLIASDLLFRRYSLRLFNTAVVGIFSGYLMGLALATLFDSILQSTSLVSSMNTSTIEITRIALFLFGTYLGTILALRYADEIYISIPFVRFSHSIHKKKDLVLDLSALGDARIIDLASTCLLDHLLVVPKFLVKMLNMQVECGDEMAKTRARKTLENLKKLENLTHLQLRYAETDFPDIKDLQQKMTRLARLSDANIITADTSRTGFIPSEEITFINLHALSNALKPLTPPGENITIKVQRYGKEPKQGVGYLEDGTMVVINNGGDYIGETIETQVISVKQTSAGRIIFTNAIVEDHNYNSLHTYEQQTIYEHQHD